MTPEEKAFEVVADDSWEDDSSGDNVRYTDYDKLRALIAQAIREAKIEAYDGAMKAVCWYCHEGMSVVIGSYGKLSHRGDEYGTLTDCDAANIRALRDSLVPIEVSS